MIFLSSDCDIRLTGDQSVSRKHAVIHLTGNSVSLSLSLSVLHFSLSTSPPVFSLKIRLPLNGSSDSLSNIHINMCMCTVCTVIPPYDREQKCSAYKCLFWRFLLSLTQHLTNTLYTLTSHTCTLYLVSLSPCAQPGRVYVTDCKSKFGTVINNSTLTANQRLELHHNDIIKFGQGPSSVNSEFK